MTIISVIVTSYRFQATTGCGRWSTWCWRTSPSSRMRSWNASSSTSRTSSRLNSRVVRNVYSSPTCLASTHPEALSRRRGWRLFTFWGTPKTWLSPPTTTWPLSLRTSAVSPSPTSSISSWMEKVGGEGRDDGAGECCFVMPQLSTFDCTLSWTGRHVARRLFACSGDSKIMQHLWLIVWFHLIFFFFFWSFLKIVSEFRSLCSISFKDIKRNRKGICFVHFF